MVRQFQYAIAHFDGDRGDQRVGVRMEQTPAEQRGVQGVGELRAPQPRVVEQAAGDARVVQGHQVRVPVQVRVVEFEDAVHDFAEAGRGQFVQQCRALGVPPVEVVEHDLEQDRVTVGEELIDRRDGNVGMVGDRASGHGVGPIRFQQRHRCRSDSFDPPSAALLHRLAPTEGVVADHVGNGLTRIT